MRWAVLFLVSLYPLAAIASIPQLAWRVGMEREVDEGTYAKLVAEAQGWRLWRFETRHGHTCSLVKSAVGRPHPAPIGVGAALWKGSPYIRIQFGGMSESASLHGRFSETKREWRRPGDRFWQPFTSQTPWDEFDGHRIEVHVESWEYEAILVGLEDERGVIDFRGLAPMLDAARECGRG